MKRSAYERGAADDSSIVNVRAGEFHRAATILTLLVFLWGVIAVAFVPWKPFGAPNVGQIVIGAALLGYLGGTWKRPRLRVVQGITALAIGYTLLRLPWAAVMWSRLGRPLEAFTVPHVAAVAVGLVYPGRTSRGMIVVFLFGAEALFAFFYAQHVGLHELLPLTEPLGTFAFTTLGLGLLILRQRTRDLAQQHILARAELEALERIRPLFAHTEQILEAQVEVITSEVGASGVRHPDAEASLLGRSLERLGNLRHSVGRLTTSEQTAPSLHEAERRLVDHDAQLGATLLAGLGAMVSLPAILVFRTELGRVTVPYMTGLFVLFVAALSCLVFTRRRPSSRRAIWIVLVLYVVTLVIVSFNEYVLLEAGRPFAPFLGHKLLMGALGLTVAARFKLGSALIALTAATAVVLYFGLHLSAHTDIVETAEPFATLIFMVVGESSLRRLERRQISSIQLLRDQAEAAALLRRARMFLALRDQLNSPVQTLVLGVAGSMPKLQPSSGARVQTAIDRLVDLSRELADVDVPVPRAANGLSFDAEAELRRRI